MNHALSLNPIAPVPQIVLLALACIALAIWQYRRSGNLQSGRMRLLAVLRCATLAIIAFLLLNPVLTLAAHYLERPPLLVLLDTSHSMSIADVDGHRRFDVARDTTVGNQASLDALSKRFSVQLYGFSDNAVHSDIDTFIRTAKPNGTATKIGDAIATAVESQPEGESGGVLIVSDGRNNGDFSPVEAASESRERGFPVFTMCLGANAHGQNASILNRHPQMFAAPGQTVPLTAELRSVGLDGQTAHVQLINATGAVLTTKDYTLDDNHAVPVFFPVTQAKPGNYRYSIAIVPIPGEVTIADNKTSVFLQVIKSKARILVLEARPSWDAKFLIQALRSDPTITVDAIFKLTDEKTFALKQQSDNTPDGDTNLPPGTDISEGNSIKVPTTAAEFAHYDVIIIGKGYSDFFGPTAVSALEEYVANHAGNIIFLRGKAEDGSTDTLRQLEPVQWASDQVDDIRMEVTQEGKSNPAFDFTDHPDPQLVVQKLPSLLSATRVQGQKALSVVLARSSNVSGSDPAQEMAVLAYQNYGQGKVVALAGEGLWQWALLPPTMNGYSGCFNEFWTQMMHWLVNQSDFLPGQNVSLKTDRASYTPGDTVDLLAFTRGMARPSLPPVEITDPDGRSTQVILARGPAGQADFAGTYRAVKPGEYVASMIHEGGGIIRVPFSVYPGTEEDLITAADPTAMRAIARAGGGDTVTPDDLNTLPAKFKLAQQALATSAEPQTAWDRWWVLATILFLLAAEWLLRRRSGLI